MELTGLQTRLIEAMQKTLGEIGIEDVRQKTKRVEFDDGEADELQVQLSFAIEDDAFEIWAYPEEAGVLEPDGEWFDFSRDEFATEEELVGAVVEYLNGLFEDE